MKFKRYINEVLGDRFWNNLINKINMQFTDSRSRMMLRTNKETGMHMILMVNTFHPFPKAFLSLVKSSVKPKDDEVIDEKGRKIMLSDDNWRKVFRAVAKSERK